MPQFGGKDSKRHFTVVMGGKEHGLYVSSTPSSAAKKAVTKLCAANKSKKVEFHIREITQGSKKKTYGPYSGHIEKLKEPIKLEGRVIKYKPVAKLSSKTGAKKGGMRGGGDMYVRPFGYSDNSCILTTKEDAYPLDKYILFTINFNNLVITRDIFKYLNLFSLFQFAGELELKNSNQKVAENSSGHSEFQWNTSNFIKRYQSTINKIVSHLDGLSSLKHIDIIGKPIYIYISKEKFDILEKMMSIRRFQKISDNSYYFR